MATITSDPPDIREVPHDHQPSDERSIRFGVGADDGRVEHPTRRPITARLSAGHLIALGAGLVGAVASFLILRSAGDTTTIAVARDDVPRGALLDETVVELVEVSVEDVAVSRTIDVGDGEPRYASTRLAAGDPVLESVASATPPDSGLVEMEILVDVTPSRVEVGDEVGIIGVVTQASTSTATWLAVGVPVLAIGEADGGILSADRGIRIVLEVDGTQALAIGAAQEAGELTIVESSGDISAVDLDERVLVSLDAVGRTAPSVGDDQAEVRE